MHQRVFVNRHGFAVHTGRFQRFDEAAVMAQLRGEVYFIKQLYRMDVGFDTCDGGVIPLRVFLYLLLDDGGDFLYLRHIIISGKKPALLHHRRDKLQLAEHLDKLTVQTVQRPLHLEVFLTHILVQHISRDLRSFRDEKSHNPFSVGGGRACGDYRPDQRDNK